MDSRRSVHLTEVACTAVVRVHVDDELFVAGRSYGRPPVDPKRLCASTASSKIDVRSAPALPSQFERLAQPGPRRVRRDFRARLKRIRPHVLRRVARVLSMPLPVLRQCFFLQGPAPRISSASLYLSISQPALDSSPCYGRGNSFDNPS
jgi:hypothetical protein